LTKLGGDGLAHLPKHRDFDMLQGFAAWIASCIGSAASSIWLLLTR
jgi:hypothetical protein